MRAVLSAAAAAAALACAIGAEAATPALKPTASQEEIEAWVHEHVLDGLDARALITAKGAELFSPLELEKLPDGHLVGWFRAEFAWPQKIGKVSYRSMRQRVEIDCAAMKVKILAREAYADNNLEGRATPAPVTGEWSAVLPEDTGPGQEARQACSFASLVGSPDWAKAMPSPPISASSEALRIWFARYIELGDYRPLDDLGVYYSTKDLEKLPGDRLRARIRRELVFPGTLEMTGLRSSATLEEIDCRAARRRTLDLVVFPGSNMLGTPYGDFAADGEPWTPIHAGANEARSYRALCRIANDPKIDLEAALQPPEIPTLDDADAPAIREWLDKHINTNGYVVSSYDPESVYFYANDLALQRDGNIAGSIRVESLNGPRSTMAGARSWILNLEFDCRRRRVRQTSAAYYERNNLEGQSVEDPAVGWTTAPAESHIGNALVHVCAQSSLLAPEVDHELAFPPPPAGDSEEGIAEWVSQYVEAPDYAYAGFTGDGVGFYSTTDGERRANDHLRIWTRFEFFDPQFDDGTIFRSVRVLREYDCEQGRSRVLASEIYPGANLTGDVVKDQESEAEWTYVEPNTLDSVFNDKLCSLKDAVDSGVSEPRLPRPDAKQPL